jgi:hypothetical protein
MIPEALFYQLSLISLMWCGCVLCEQETAHPKPPSSVLPAPMPATHRHPVKLPPRGLLSPPRLCLSGLAGIEQPARHRASQRCPWCQFRCTSWKGYFLKTQGTLLHGKRVALKLMVHVLACLAEACVLPLESTFRRCGSDWWARWTSPRPLPPTSCVKPPDARCKWTNSTLYSSSYPTI